MSNIKYGQYSISSDVFQAIKNSSEKYNVPFKFMMAIAAKESSFNPNAKSNTSSATGLYQFIKKTWESMWPDSDFIPDPKDPFLNADAGARFIKQIQTKLKTDDFALLYLGHFLGPSCAFKFMNALKENPLQSIDKIVSQKQIDSNKSVFLKNNKMKNLQEIYDWSNKGINNIIKV
jgi:hypothetical protein